MKTLQEVYESLPKISCKRLCQECCGPVIPAACLPEEAAKLIVLPVKRLVHPDGTCGALLHGACSVYKDRPLICRLYGCVKAMQCPYGCKPEFWLTDSQVEDILRAHGGWKWIGRIHR